MASRFETSMRKANEKVFSAFKDDEEVTFTPKGGTAFSTEAILGAIEGGIKDDDTGETSVKNCRITIPVPEATVEYADGIITAKGEDWIVDDIIGIASGMVDLQCRWLKPVSRHGEGHIKKSK